MLPLLRAFINRESFAKAHVSMASNASHRKSVVCSLLQQRHQRLLDIGSGPITPDYPYSEHADEVVCLDWQIRTYGTIAGNIQCIRGDFADLDAEATFDAIIAADVFEHIAIEKENEFIRRCIDTLMPGGSLIISVPHRGTFSFLDPYAIKPLVQRWLWKVGMYKSTHNGTCDIRKGHKHYTVEELQQRFTPLLLDRVVYYGFFFDPLLTWADALSRRIGQVPGYKAIEDATRREFSKSYGERSFNVAVRFLKRL